MSLTARPIGGRFAFGLLVYFVAPDRPLAVASSLRGTAFWCSEFFRNAFKEQTMKRLALAIGFLTIALAASTPVRADYAVIQFRDGRCEIWQDSGSDPWGAEWTKLAFGFPYYAEAQNARDSAFARGVCR
jgi:hypothetical protein